MHVPEANVQRWYQYDNQAYYREDIQSQIKKFSRPSFPQEWGD